MAKNMNSVLKDALIIVKPSVSETSGINKSLDEFLKKLESNKKKAGTDADIFIGGSAAKDTMIKKDFYDIDIFVRFDKKYPDERLSQITEKLLSGIKFEKIHGSRDYFQVKSGENIFFEIVPVKRVKSPKEATNITDLSYSHVKYIKRKIKNKQKILDDIALAKAFCYSNNFYGAESHIKGFSGYGIELLIYNYKSFLGFLRAMTKIKPGKKEVIDIESHHKLKKNILIDLNAAKLQSPIVLIDPTFKQRNVLAALSQETFLAFQKSARDFLKNPRISAFEKKSLDWKKAKKTSETGNNEFILLQAKTNKQEGDIAGSKLLKFFNLLEREISRHFEIKNKGFEYGKNKSAVYFFSVKPKTNFLVQGPNVKDRKHVERFRKKHKKILIKNNRLHTRLTTKTSIKKFLGSWKTKQVNKKIMREMSITGVEIRN